MSVEIYGKNACQEILKTNKPIIKAYLLEHSNQDFLADLNKKHIKTEVLDKQMFNQRFTGNHQGIVFEIEDYKTLSLDEFLENLQTEKCPLVIMLDGITDVHNLGAIIRTAEAGGVAGIIIPKHRSAKITGTVAKISSGAIEHMNIIEVTNLRNALEKLKDRGFWTVGTSLDSKETYDKIFVDRPLCVVIGSEGKGMSKLLKKVVDFNVKIPMVGKTNSLNASVSAGIIIFDILRKKQS